MASVGDMLRAALARHQTGELATAETMYRQLLDVEPEQPDALHLLGIVASQTERHELAVELIQRAIAVRGYVADYHVNLGGAYRDLGRWDEAVACGRRALELKPEAPEIQMNLGLFLKDQGNLAEAVVWYQQAIARRPEFAEAHSNLGNALRLLDRTDEAIACYQRALALRPNDAEAHNNLALTLNDRCELDAAEWHYTEALRLRPDFDDPRFSRAMLRLLRGDFQRGWPDYERRWSYAELRPRPFRQPLWDGSPLQGRTILLHAEQGLGDTLMFVRYAPLVATSGGRVLVECQPELVRLLQSVAGIAGLIPAGSPLPPFDVHLPLLSLPGVFQTNASTIPANVPYIHPIPADVARRQTAGASTLGPRVGLVWRGSQQHRNDRRRSISLADLAPLASVPGITFISLQKGEAALEALRPPAGMTLIDPMFDIRDFADTATLVANLDLVIAVDTSVAHLAGAMGRPVWTLLPYNPDWRWGLDRDDTPWYPTMRLFRQPAIGDWAGAVAQVATALLRFAEDVARSPPK